MLTPESRGVLPRLLGYAKLLILLINIVFTPYPLKSRVILYVCVRNACVCVHICVPTYTSITYILGVLGVNREKGNKYKQLKHP